MRRLAFLTITLSAVLSLAGPAVADSSRIELSDDKLPLLELRPLDRRVYVLTLDGKWLHPANAGKAYYINLLFPNGQSFNHRALDDTLFRQGEVRAVLQDYQLKRGGVAEGGKLRVFISEGKPTTSAEAPEVVSNVLQVAWPMDRPVVPRPPRSRYSPLPPVDPFPPLENELPPRAPAVLPPPKPAAEPAPPPKPADGE